MIADLGLSLAVLAVACAAIGTLGLLDAVAQQMHERARQRRLWDAYLDECERCRRAGLPPPELPKEMRA